jgi:DnaJ domain
MAEPSGLTRSAALAMLGLTARASAREVTRAYRRLAKTTHPDIAGPSDQDATRRFAALTDAYHLLTPTPATPSPPVPAPLRRPIPVRVRFAQQPPIVAGPVRVTSPDPAPTARRPT